LFEVSPTRSTPRCRRRCPACSREIRVQEGDTVRRRRRDRRRRRRRLLPPLTPLRPSRKQMPPPQPEPEAQPEHRGAAGSRGAAAARAPRHSPSPRLSCSPRHDSELPLLSRSPAPAAPARAAHAARAPARCGGRRPPRLRENRLLSPVVRRLVAEHGLDPDDDRRATGPGGRITRDDVLDHIDKPRRAGRQRSAAGTGRSAGCDRSLLTLHPTPVAEPATGARCCPGRCASLLRLLRPLLLRSKPAAAAATGGHHGRTRFGGEAQSKIRKSHR
jgi:pyruvate/2-oxoglutarate dehydrogenase complex dihydrolipoamide acyltransferase (E2) component